jgi:hypothetical protein
MFLKCSIALRPNSHAHKFSVAQLTDLTNSDRRNWDKVATKSNRGELQRADGEAERRIQEGMVILLRVGTIVPSLEKKELEILLEH